jgi:hypothetical protein
MYDECFLFLLALPSNCRTSFLDARKNEKANKQKREKNTSQ